MSKLFINSLIRRSSGETTDVQPRIPGKYEQGTGSPPISPEGESGLTQRNVQFSEQRSLNVNEIKEFHAGDRDYFQGGRPLSSTTNESFFSNPLSGTSSNNSPNTSEATMHEKQKRKRPEPDYKLIYSGRISDKSEPLQYNASGHQEKNEDAANNPVNNTGKVNSIQAVQIKPLRQSGKFFHQWPPVPEIIPADQLHNADLRQNKDKHVIPPVTHPVQEGLTGVNAGLNNERKTLDPVQTINVSIGRVEVRVFQPPPQEQTKPKNEVTTIMGLDQYLDQRKQGIK